MSQTQVAKALQYPFGSIGIDPLLPELGPDGIGRVVLPTGRQAWLFTRHEHVRELLRSPDLSSDATRPGFPLIRQLPREPIRSDGSFIRMDPPEHTRFRRLLTPEFMIKQVRQLEPLISECVGEALERMRAEGSPADLIRHFAVPVPSMVICHLLGVPYADHEFFQERSRVLLAWDSSMEAIVSAADQLRDYLSGLVATRLRSPGDDLISRLAARVAAGELTESELVGLSVLLLIAGHETTANMIGLSVLLLLRHPDQLRRLRQRPELIEDAVEELLRYLTIVRNGLARVATADIVVAGHRIAAGEGVIAMLSAVNRDPAVFPGGDSLEVERGSHQHLAFGFGIHQCIGQPLARAELRIALSELFTRLPGLALVDDPAEVRYRDAVVFGVQRLEVSW
jgi:cytochrome P450